MHAHMHAQQSVDRTSASGQLSDSFVNNVDSCDEDGFFLFFEYGHVAVGIICSPHKLAFDLASTPTMPDSGRHRSSIALPPETMSSTLFAKLVSFEHSIIPNALWLLREEKKTWTGKKFFSAQSRISPLHRACMIMISAHFAAGAVDVGRCAVSFLATDLESTGAVLTPTQMSRIAYCRATVTITTKSSEILPKKAQTRSPCMRAH